ncbi:MAG: hypothetical protein E4H27_05085 [Anaerolineales bacterium]|nr:MAG: hypothetical protein E4H27_05085 [Anaerolineales bacterium]
MTAQIPLIDYHVHLSPDLTLENAVKLAAERQMQFGIVEHPGPGAGIETDAGLGDYIAALRRYPVFVGLQPMYRDWSRAFSTDAIKQLDYVLMDADTVPLDDGKWLHIWKHDNFIDDLHVFMDQYLQHIANILMYEPINIFGRPTYLPINFARHYDEIWTDERMHLIIDLAKERNIALEIAENVRVPSMAFIKRAKAEEIKFTFGTNARNQNAGNLHYCLEMAEVCGLTKNDMFYLDK